MLTTSKLSNIFVGFYLARLVREKERLMEGEIHGGECTDLVREQGRLKSAAPGSTTRRYSGDQYGA